jgi:hypothetical protein
MEIVLGMIAIYVVIGLSGSVNHFYSRLVVCALGQSEDLMHLIPLSRRIALNEPLNRKEK